MDQVKSLRKIDFILYLRRSYDLLTVEAHALGYTWEMRRALGFTFNYLGYLSDGKVVDILRTKRELDGFNQVLKEVVVHKPNKALAMLREGEQLERRMRALVRQSSRLKKRWRKYDGRRLGETFRKLFLVYGKQFFATTALPYRVGVILTDLIQDTPLPQYKKMLKIVNKLRAQTTHLSFEAKVLAALLEETARRQRLRDSRLLVNLKPEEISQLILGKLSFSDQELRRRKSYAYFIIRGKPVIYYGQHHYHWYRKKILPPKISAAHARKLVGQVAFPGKVRGKVRLVFTPEDVARFKRGEILVSINSNPSFIAALKKTAALVTDEGGVTCHAAIVSRELKIPCVMGTKVATEVFKNSDLIEVDAYQGLVRRVR